MACVLSNHMAKPGERHVSTILHSSEGRFGCVCVGLARGKRAGERASARVQEAETSEEAFLRAPALATS